MKIAVFGDLGTDRYLICQPRGLSAEAPIPILDQVREVELPGMAGNLAANLQAFGLEGRFHFVGGNRPCKNRLVTEDGHQIARFDVEDWCQPYQPELEEDVAEADMIVVSDYAKGSIHPAMIAFLNGTGLPMYIDTKADPAIWRKGDDVLLFPNRSEYEEFWEGYDQFPHVILKQGSLGVAYMQYGKVILTRPSQADPSKVRCVNGAGDTVMAAMVAASTLGIPLIRALEFAMAAAANVVEQTFEQRTTTLEEAALRLAEWENKDWFDREMSVA